MKTLPASAQIIGTHVFRIMDQRGQKRAWLAEQLGCHPATVSKIEAGQRRIPRWFIDGCVRVFGLPEESLFFGLNGLTSPELGPNGHRESINAAD